LSPTEDENAKKMMLFNNALKRHEDILKIEGEAQKDISKAVGSELNRISSNPVLDGTLVYEGASKPFKIRDMVKDGIFNLSDPTFSDPTYGAASNHLVITTDPEKFFKVVKNSVKLVMLIAPWSSIHNNLKTSSAPFEPIMKEWDEKTAPIGIFWRMERWEKSEFYDYLISQDLASISKNNLLENYKLATFVGSNGNRGKGAGVYLPKIHVHFGNLNKD
jgi:hypothetical protein